MNRAENMDTVARDLVRWAESNESVRSLFWYGSYARGEVGMRSDFDVALLLNEDADTDSVLESITTELAEDMRYAAGARGSARRAYWVGDDLLKIDVCAACLPEGLAWLADAHDVPPPRLQLAFDRDGAGEELAARGALSATADARSLADAEVEKFLVGLEASSSALRDGDAYRFYFEYNLALGRLVRLIQIARVGPVHLYLPRGLLRECLTEVERQEFVKLAGTMDLDEAGPLLKQLADIFLRIAEELARNNRSARRPQELREFVGVMLHRET
jgi:predicted nucleotidyltransferase